MVPIQSVSMKLLGIRVPVSLALSLQRTYKTVTVSFKLRAKFSCIGNCVVHRIDTLRYWKCFIVRVAGLVVHESYVD